MERTSAAERLCELASDVVGVMGDVDICELIWSLFRWISEVVEPQPIELSEVKQLAPKRLAFFRVVLRVFRR